MGFFSGLTASALVPIGAELIGGAFSAFGAERQNREARRATARQMEFQERMARNAYQYATEDMRAAGLNPLLAYSQGGASTPGGSTYQPQNVLAGAGAGISRGAATALATRRLKKEIDATDALIDLQKAQRTKTFQETAESSSRTQQNFQNMQLTAQDIILRKADIDKRLNETERLKIQNAISRYGIEGAAALAERAQTDKMYAASDEGKTMIWIGNALKDLGLSGDEVVKALSRLIPNIIRGSGKFERKPPKRPGPPKRR